MSRSLRARAHYERNRDRYRPLLENLAAVILDPAGYFRAVRSFIGEEYRRRVGTAFSATLLLVTAVILLIAFIVLFFISAFLFLDDHVRNPAASAFLLAWAAVVLFFIVVRLSLQRYRNIAGKQR
jgi:ABC-type nickel/cobalt efflux system permease component RcnA